MVSLSLFICSTPPLSASLKTTLCSVWWQARMKWLALRFPSTALTDNHYTSWLPQHADSTLPKPISQYIMLLWLSVTALTGMGLKNASVDRKLFKAYIPIAKFQSGLCGQHWDCPGQGHQWPTADGIHWHELHLNYPWPPLSLWYSGPYRNQVSDELRWHQQSVKQALVCYT